MKVLFIGNSYTFFNDMPTLLESLAGENSKELTQDSVTKGGRRLYENLEEGDEHGERIKALVSENDYDALILQEQSFLAIVDYKAFLGGIRDLVALVKAKRNILYATWGRKTGSEKLTELELTSEEMTNKLTEAYISAAKHVNAEISHVGKTFLKISKAMPDLEIYKPDLSHPSYLGSVVAAICHYRTLFGEMPKSVDCFELDSVQKAELLSLIAEALNEG